MMTTRLCFLLTVLPLFLLAGCHKNDGVNQNLNPDNQNTFDFMSTKEGSYWRYGVKDGVSYNRYARDRDSMMLGMKYSYYERKDDNAGGFQPEYFGKNDGYYFTLIDVDGNANNYAAYAFWQVDAPAGTSWKNTGRIASPLGNVNVLIESNVAEDNLTMSFSGHTFTKAVHVHSDLKAGLLNTGVGTVDIWVVKGFGVIREEANIDILGQYQVQHTDSLIDYQIVP